MALKRRFAFEDVHDAEQALVEDMLLKRDRGPRSDPRLEAANISSEKKKETHDRESVARDEIILERTAVSKLGSFGQTQSRRVQHLPCSGSIVSSLGDVRGQRGSRVAHNVEVDLIPRILDQVHLEHRVPRLSHDFAPFHPNETTVERGERQVLLEERVVLLHQGLEVRIRVPCSSIDRERETVSVTGESRPFVLRLTV